MGLVVIFPSWPLAFPWPLQPPARLVRMPNYYLWLIGALFSLLSFLKKKDGYIGKISRDLSVLASVALQPTMRLVSLVCQIDGL